MNTPFKLVLRLAQRLLPGLKLADERITIVYACFMKPVEIPSKSPTSLDASAPRCSAAEPSTSWLPSTPIVLPNTSG
jgi:hypothetical protein